MEIKKHTAAPRAALAVGLFFTPPASMATDAIVSTVVSLAAAAIGNLGFISPAMGEPAALTKKQSDALDTYNNSRSHFESILGQRRAQINSNQRLPNLPGQALYLARNNMMSAYKDLTDALPSKIGGPNKYGNPSGFISTSPHHESVWPFGPASWITCPWGCDAEPTSQRTDVAAINAVSATATVRGRHSVMPNKRYAAQVHNDCQL